VNTQEGRFPEKSVNSCSTVFSHNCNNGL